MKKIFISLLFFVISISSKAQNKFTLEGKFGPGGNFFVKSYDEKSGPTNKTAFFNKNFIGTCAGVELAYHLGSKSSLAVAYNHTTNLKTINFSGPFNSIYLLIRDFDIKHIDNYYEFVYNRKLCKKSSSFNFQLGVFYLRMKQQEIELQNYNNEISIDERNYKNCKLEELGTSIGVKYQIKIDQKFDVGIRSSVYYLISTNSFEAITLTPTLSFKF